MRNVAEPIRFHGWSAVRLSNGIITAIAVPELGGRLMSFQLGDHEYLFRNPALLGRRFNPPQHIGDGTLLAWKNYGGEKTWPAPQGWAGPGQWPGPPDPYIDSGVYQHTRFEDGASCGVVMTSPIHPGIGLRVQRRITLAPHSSVLRLDVEFENISTKAVRWSIWDVAQLDCSIQSPAGSARDPNCWLYIPTGEVRAGAKPYWVMVGAETSQWQPEIRPGQMGVHYLGDVAKIGVRNPDGWMAFSNHTTGHSLCWRFPFDAGADYPDGGVNVECWTESPDVTPPIPFHSAGYLLEAELLSPLRVIEPGQVSRFSFTWAATGCAGPFAGASDLACVNEPLQVSRLAAGLRITGRFGCFAAGTARLRAEDAAGKTVLTHDLGAVSPLRALAVDATLRAPDTAQRMRLELLDTDGTAGLLATAAVQAA